MTHRLPSRLYAIADPDAARRDVVEVVEELLAGGAALIQIRCKTLPTGDFVDAAVRCRASTRARGAVLIVNDRVDVAMACDADGVHLGQSDLPPGIARRLLGAGRWIGVSTHDPEQARAAVEAGADYIGFGPIVTTRTKDTGYTARGLDALRIVRQSVEVPIVAIGGITPDNAAGVLDAGADAVAMISALVSSGSTRERVRSILARLEPAPLP